MTSDASTAMKKKPTALETPRTIALVGDVSGSAVFDGTSDIVITTTYGGNSVELGVDTTGIYVATVTGSTGVTVVNSSTEDTNNITISIGQPVAPTDSVSFNNLTLSGNLTVLGTTTTINSENTTMQDAIIELASGNSTGVLPFIGLRANRGVTDAFWVWDEANDWWFPGLSSDGSTFTNGNVRVNTITADTIIGPVSSTTTTYPTSGGTTVGVTTAVQVPVATTGTTVLSSLPITGFRSVKLMVQITQGSSYQVSEVLLIHNGTTAFMTEYAIVETAGNLGTLSADVSGGNVRLLVNMVSAAAATVNILRTAIVV